MIERARRRPGTNRGAARSRPSYLNSCGTEDGNRYTVIVRQHKTLDRSYALKDGTPFHYEDESDFALPSAKMLTQARTDEQSSDPVATKSFKLELRDITHLAVTTEPGGAAVIVGRSFDDRQIEILLSGQALTKLEALIAQANLEQAKLHLKH